MRALVVYYSHSGNTRRLAEQIAQESGGVLLELVPQDPYPAAYRALVTQATRELREGVLPALSGELPEIDGFDVVFIGTPNWCGTAAPPVLTYLSQTDLRGRRVAPFCTHGGGGTGHIGADVAHACPGAQVGEMLAVAGAAVEPGTVREWVRRVCNIS